MSLKNSTRTPQLILRSVLLCVLVLFVDVAAAAAHPADLRLPPYSKTVLSNGTVLLLMEQHEIPVISVSVLVSAGSTSDPARKEGVASLTAELLRRGTAQRSAEEISASLDYLGGEISFEAGLDYTAGRAEFLKKDIVAGLDLLADILLAPSFSQAEVQKRIDQRVDELKQIKDEPGTLITNYFHSFLYGEHPYARSIDGDEKTVAGLTRDDVVAFYRSHYLPYNLRIAVAGDFHASEMQNLLEERFAKQSTTKAVAAAEPHLEPPQLVTQRKVLLVDKPDATQSFFIIGNVGIAHTNSDRVPLQVVNTIFGGRFTSMLNDELRTSSGLTYGAVSVFSGYRVPGPFRIYSFTENSKTTNAIDMALGILRRLHTNGVTEAQLTSAKAYIKGQFPPKIETTDQLASLMTRLDYFGWDEREINDYFPRVEAVTLQDCQQVVARYFPDTNFVLVIIGKAAEVEKSLSKYGDVQVRRITQVGFR